MGAGSADYLVALSSYYHLYYNPTGYYSGHHTHIFLQRGSVRCAEFFYRIVYIHSRAIHIVRPRHFQRIF